MGITDHIRTDSKHLDEIKINFPFELGKILGSLNVLEFKVYLIENMGVDYDDITKFKKAIEEFTEKAFKKEGE